jgi:3-hydroxyisobutyrate dehydrogenase-like beta-hydroxyacid dehydrogenase
MSRSDQLAFKCLNAGPCGLLVLKRVDPAAQEEQDVVEHGERLRLGQGLFGVVGDVALERHQCRYRRGGHLALHYKDLGYLLEMAHDSGANIPISSLVHEIFKTSKKYGEPNWKQPGIQTYWKRLNQDRS